MSSEYPMLGDRPIDQFKVTELKEELKKRKLSYSGLKADLIKRLDEAIRIERENAVEANNGFNEMQPMGVEKEIKSVATDTGTVKTGKEDVEGQIDTNDGSSVVAQAEVGDKAKFDIDTLGVTKDPVIQSTNAESSMVISEPVGTEVWSSDCLESVKTGAEKDKLNAEADSGIPNQPQDNEVSNPQLMNEGQDQNLMVVDPKPQLEYEDSKSQLDNVDPKPQPENQDLKPPPENQDLKPQPENQDLKPQPESEGLKPSSEDMPDPSATNNQVPVVSPNLGFQVKSDSISTDSVSINEKTELKDNIIADNVKLDLDVVKPEMVGPSSSNFVPVSGESHPMDVEEPLENKDFVEERDGKIVADPDMKKKNDIPDVGYLEKLNLDRSSGDDFMEEDMLGSKQIDSKFSADELGDKSEKNEVASVEEESPVDVVGDGLSSDRKDITAENQSHPAVPAEKRKLPEQETVASYEPSKRRKWNSGSSKVQEDQQGSNLTPTTTPKDTFQPLALKRNFARSDSMASEDEHRERVVPPPQKPPTNSLRIDRFLRPFTLKAVEELLGKTGTVTSFWMDQIKTHCYVTYSSVEEAIETRNAVYNLQWPPNGGRQLVAEFVDPQEVQMRLQALSQGPTTPGATGSAGAPSDPTAHPKPSPRQQASRQQLPPPSALPSPPPLSNPPLVRERLPPPPPPLEKLEAPIVTLDDLFQKTKATPRIYYLPLSEEQVAAKRAAREKNSRQ